MIQQEFIQKISAAAIRDMQVSGILASVTIAQAILESGWGTSDLAIRANALFGIKADKRWSGACYETQTTEWFYFKKPVTITAYFRAYDSWDDSITDHSQFLISSSRYDAVIRAGSYKTACTELQRAGYSTDPEYAAKLIRLIEEYYLTQYDKRTIHMKINTKRSHSGNFTCQGREKVKYIVVHYTGNEGDTAKNNVDYFARESLGRSAHYFVDEREIWESVSPDCVAWHSGAKKFRHPECRNANSIGVEICMNDKKGRIRQGSIDHAAQLVRELMARYGVPVERVIRHYDVTGKDCPAPMVNDTALWQAFRAKLTAPPKQEEQDEMKTYKHTAEMPDWAQDTFRRLVAAKIVSVDAKGELAVSESSVQPMVYLDRLCEGRIEELPKIMRMLISFYELCGEKIEELPKLLAKMQA